MCSEKRMEFNLYHIFICKCSVYNSLIFLAPKKKIVQRAFEKTNEMDLRQVLSPVAYSHIILML